MGKYLLLLNYKYLASGSYDYNLKDNITYILLDNKILDSKFYHIFNDGIRIMLPNMFNESALRIISMDNFGVLLNENKTILFNENILSPNQNIISPYFSNMYYVVIDRFFNVKNDSSGINHIDLSIDKKVNFYGGNFSGISKKINNGYFNRLGINNIILSPIATILKVTIEVISLHIENIWDLMDHGLLKQIPLIRDLAHLMT